MTTHTSPLPSLIDMLPDQTYDGLRLLRREVRHRHKITLLEQVAREVGSRVYAEFLPQLWDSTCYIRRGHIAGLPPGTYANLLTTSIRRMRAEVSGAANTGDAAGCALSDVSST